LHVTFTSEDWVYGGSRYQDILEDKEEAAAAEYRRKLLQYMRQETKEFQKKNERKAIDVLAAYMIANGNLKICSSISSSSSSPN
jgi:hypothetical protein